MTQPIRIGIDLGGTKIEGLALDPSGDELARLRIPTPQHDYAATVQAIVSVVHDLERRIGGIASTREQATVGIGIPGTVVRTTGLVKNANSTWLNGQPLERDLSLALRRPVRCANDANCLAVSEATDGAASSAELTFAVILGTGCGGGIAIRTPAGAHARIGPNGVSGEWGHNPLPWATTDELPGPPCYCGQRGCLETWISGTGLANDYARANPDCLDDLMTAINTQGIDVLLKRQAAGFGAMPTAIEIVSAAASGDPLAEASLTRLEDRIGRALAMAVNLLDPDVIVIGGGLSKLDRLYANLPALVERHLFGGGALATPILKAKHGDASGVRGAAWL